MQKKFDWMYDENRDFIQKEKFDFINKELNQLAIHEQLLKLALYNTRMDFDATSFYPSALWD